MEWQQQKTKQKEIPNSCNMIDADDWVWVRWKIVELRSRKSDKASLIGKKKQQPRFTVDEWIPRVEFGCMSIILYETQIKDDGIRWDADLKME